MRSPTSIQRKGQDHGQTTKEQQRDQEAAGHDSQREEGCKESEEKRKATHGRVSRPVLPSLFSELKRRNVVRVGTAYALVAWLIAQAGDPRELQCWVTPVRRS